MICWVSYNGGDIVRDIELLQYVHKTAAMGIKGLEDIKGSIHEPGLQKAVSQQIQEYKRISESSSALIRSKGKEPQGLGLIAQLSSEVMSTAKTMADSSASNIAEMVIQGNTMGIVKGTQHLNDYAGDDPKVKSLAEKLIQTEQANVEQMKKYL